QQAIGLKLIDQISDFPGAIQDTARSVGIKGEPSIVRPTKPKRTLADLLFGDVSEFLPDKAKMLETHLGFYYLWQ
ncbi:MAG TPA: signal peptide peptidase SppA, partial [Terriglobales bacterium]